MKRLLSVLTAAALMTAAAPLSASGFSDDETVMSGLYKGVWFDYTGYDSADMTITIVGADKDSGELEIPGSLDGYMVTGIGEKAFFCNTELTSVTFPDTLKSIGDNAFTGCTSLEKAILPDGIASLGSSCFMSCTSLKEISLGSTLSEIPEKCFFGCSSLAAADLPENLSSIGEEAFFNCTSLKKMVFETPDVYIGYNAIGRRYDLRSGYVANVEDFSIYAVPDENVQYYCSDNSFPLIEISGQTTGDADLNGMITAADATAVLKEYANTAASEAPVFTRLQKKNSDLDNDGMLTAKDASLILILYADSQM